MTKMYPDYPNPTMIYNAGNEYTIIDAADLAEHLDAGWLTKPRGESEPTPFSGEPLPPRDAPPEADPAVPGDEPAISDMTKAQLLDHAQEAHGLELSDKLTKEKIIEVIAAATA